MMHIEKNVCESLIGTLLNIHVKTKDGENARLDLIAIGIRESLKLVLEDLKRTFLPVTCYTLSRSEKMTVMLNFGQGKSSHWLLFKHQEFGANEGFEVDKLNVT